MSDKKVNLSSFRTTPSICLEAAHDLYQQEPCIRSLEEDISLHLTFGWLYSDPDLLVMARPVAQGADYLRLTNPALSFEEPNCWWIYLAVGDIGRALKLIPYPLAYIGWERNNEPRFHLFDRVVRDFQSPDPHFPGMRLLQGRRRKLPAPAAPGTAIPDLGGPSRGD
jgi:hypothetical protein